MNMLKAIIEAHEGNEMKTFKMLDKYDVSFNDRQDALTLMTILRDADALDRARLSSKNNMDLNPKFLRMASAKGLIDFSFGLETLTRKVPNFSTILSYDREGEKQKESLGFARKRREFSMELQNGLENVRINISNSHDRDVNKMNNLHEKDMNAR